MAKRHSHLAVDIAASALMALCLYQAGDLFAAGGMLDAQMVRPSFQFKSENARPFKPTPAAGAEGSKTMPSFRPSAPAEGADGEVRARMERQMNEAKGGNSAVGTSLPTSEPPRTNPAMCNRVRELARQMQQLAEECGGQ